MLVITRWYSFLGDVELHRAPLLQPTASNSYFSDGSWHSRKHSTSKQNRLRSDFYFGTKHMGNASWNSKPQQQDAFPKSQWDVWNQPIPSLGWKMLKVLKEILKEILKETMELCPKDSTQRRSTVTAPSDGFDVGRPAISLPLGITRNHPKTLQFSSIFMRKFWDSYDFKFLFFSSKPEKKSKELEAGRN